MNKFLRIVALFLAATFLTLTLGACGRRVDSDSEYLTKGEFMNLFAAETYLYPSSNGTTKISIDKGSRYYDAALSLVEIGYLTDKEVSEKLDEAVTKEFVAVLCVRNLFFRQSFDDVFLKDESKLADPQACKDAVGHEIVTTENGYFDANQKMTYLECQAAIDRMLYIDANSEFSAGEAEIEVQLKDNVIDITDEISEEDFVIIDPSDENFASIIDGMLSTEQPSALSAQSRTGISNLNEKSSSDNIISLGNSAGQKSESISSAFNIINLSGNSNITRLASGSANYCTLDEADTDDCVVVRVPKSDTLRKYKVGEMILFGLWRSDKVNQAALSDYKNAMVGEVVAINDQDYFYTYYTLRIPSDEKVIESAKLDKYSSKANQVNWKSEQLLSSFEGLSIGNIQITNSGIKLTISKTASNSVDSWRDAKFDVDMKYTFELKDIGVQISGFGDVLKGQIDNAICRLDYTVVNSFDASTSMRYTPDDNRNGKFLNNLSRSRFTGANAAGAKEIKIARLYADIGYGFNIEMYVYLTIQIDGSIHISIENNYGRGFKIVNNKVMPIYDSTTKLDAELNVNIEAAVHCDFSLRWIRRKGSPWADLDLQVGLGIDCTSKVFILDETHTSCDAINTGYVSDDELRAIKSSSDIDYCFNVRLYWFYEISGLNKDTKIGKVIRWFNSDFKLTTGKKSNDIKSWHFEDGHTVSDCTRDYDGVEEAEVNSTNQDTFVLNDYKIVIPEYTCGTFYIISYPVSEDKLDKMGGIVLTVADESVATAHIYKNMVIVEAVSEGSTSMTLTTKNGRFTQECSITVTNNKVD